MFLKSEIVEGAPAFQLGVAFPSTSPDYLDTTEYRSIGQYKNILR